MELDTTINQVERLYQTITGHEMPPMDPTHAEIPPERDPIRHVEEQIARLEEALGRVGTQAEPRPTWTPSISVWSAEDSLLVCVSLPGVARDHVRLSLSKRTVVIEGERPEPASAVKANAQPQFAEDAWGSFRRAVPLPTGVLTDKVDASLRDGMLTIRFQRAEQPPEETERSIPVN